ncbi:MAG: DUF4377 domain-containing protein [Deinococcales bacterium]
MSASSSEKILYVAASLAKCPRGLCWQIKERNSDNWQIFAGTIGNFDYQEGFDYILRVRETRQGNVLNYEFLELLNRSPNQAVLQGNQQNSTPRPSPSPQDLAKTSKTLYVASKLITCPQDVTTLCLQIRESSQSPWQAFMPKILDFAYQEGFDYVIKVEVLSESPVIYQLIEISSQEPNDS